MDFLPNTVLDSLQHNQCGLPFSSLVKPFPAFESKDVVRNVGPQKLLNTFGAQRDSVRRQKLSPRGTSRGGGSGKMSLLGGPNKQSKIGLRQGC